MSTGRESLARNPSMLSIGGSIVVNHRLICLQNGETASMASRQASIKQYIFQSLARNEHPTPQLVSTHFGLTRQGARRYFEQLIYDGVLVATGKTRNRQYTLSVLSDEHFELELAGVLEEIRIWRERVETQVSHLGENVQNLCHY